MKLLTPYARTIFLAAPLALSALGCQASYQTEYAPVATHRPRYDEAMYGRDWPRTQAYYASGDVVAGPTNSARQWRVGEASEPSYQRRRRLSILTDPLIALGNIALLPFSLVMDPPTEQRLYEGPILAPTYSAALPPSEVQRETAQGRRQLAREAALGQGEQAGERSLPGQEGDSPRQPGGRGMGGTGGTGGQTGQTGGSGGTGGTGSGTGSNGSGGGTGGGGGGGAGS